MAMPKVAWMARIGRLRGAARDTVESMSLAHNITFEKSSLQGRNCRENMLFL
jgi:hypothetical protein